MVTPSVPYKDVGRLIPYLRPTVWKGLSLAFILIGIKSKFYFMDRLRAEQTVYLMERGYYHQIRDGNRRWEERERHGIPQTYM
ncbi:hypothetical protein ACHWQZ_G005996 [Mnemiopsis leidyi]